MKRYSKVILGLVAAGCAVAVGFFAVSYRAPIAPVGHDQISFDRAAIARGATLAAMGNCGGCHTASNGKPYAGGFPLRTPFGTIYGSNITPDAVSGIGQWSEAAFRRAMHEGVSRDGSYLYPAFPYTHFTKVTDDDIADLYAFLMTRPAVPNTVPAPDLPFPFNIRLAMAGWNILFFQPGRFVPDASHDEAWNRGAYIAEGFGHCSSCHSPLNALGAEVTSAAYTGGEADGWIATALRGEHASSVGWNHNELGSYLSGGFSAVHGVAAGPMTGVSQALGRLPARDIDALAAYVISLRGDATTPDPKRQTASPTFSATTAQALNLSGPAKDGEAIFASACASCHVSGPQFPFYKPAPLELSSAVLASDARNLLHAVMQGVRGSTEQGPPLMPGFEAVLNDRQLAALAEYVRSRFAADLAPWKDISSNIAAIRGEADHADTQNQ